MLSTCALISHAPPKVLNQLLEQTLMASGESEKLCKVDLLPRVDPLPVSHILVVGFHHQKGSTVEYIHPPLLSFPVTEDSSLTSQLPPEWRHLPHLALPDGCHNYEQDASFFVLQPHSGMLGKGPVYGVACCRQIDSKEVKPSTDVTRSTVQKSVCVLSKYPLFGSIEAKLNQVTEAYFSTKDFSDFSILHGALASLNSTLMNSAKISLDTLHIGLSPQIQIMKFGHRLLQIFKALLLQKKVLVCGVPTNAVCRTVLSILSLFPKALEFFMHRESNEKADECGFPLEVFTSPFNVHPYLCLQQMDSLMAESQPFLLVGVANPLFQKQYSKFCDVYVNMDDGLIDVKDPKLKATLYLTSADLRFCDYVLSSVQKVNETTPTWEETTTPTTGWFGSNGWVQSQFRIYLLSLLSTSLANEGENISEFGRDFMEEWLKSLVFVNWKLSHKNCAAIAKVEPNHVCRSDMTLNDLKLRLSASASEYGISDQQKERVGQVLLRTQQAVGSVGGAVGSAWSAASAAVSSWWSGGGDED